MMTLHEAAAAMAGTLHGADRTFDGVSTDTRSIGRGELFVALRGPRFDAARFVAEAFERGAAGAVLERGARPAQAAGQIVIAVDDARAALGRLAAFWRRRFTLPLVGLTGSNGKTTVKEMIAAVLRSACGDPQQVLSTEGNLNNDIGMPLTLLRLRGHHRYAVIEMGMNHAGEIRYLADLARPTIALVNNAGSAHIGMLGTLEAIARAKGEIYDGLSADGIAIVNADDAFAGLWRAQNAARRVVDFGIERPALVTGRYGGHELSSEITIETPAGVARLSLRAPGEHNVRNALAAAATSFALGVSMTDFARGLGNFRGADGRMQRHPGLNGAVLIDDTYNANPDSTLAAIAVLARAQGRRVLVLGDMGELGEQAAREHARMGEAAAAAGIDRVLTLGALSEATSVAFGPGARHFEHIEDLLAAVELELAPDATVLVKGSRFMQMERVVQSFLAEQA